jgi:hypothetical protein
MTSPIGSSRSSTSFSAPKSVAKSASKLPLIFSVLIVTLGAALLIIFPDETISFGLVSYFFAALGPTVCLGWDTVSQRKGMKSPGFSGNRTQTRIMQFLAIGGIAIATVHMFRIADDIAEILTELWGLA